MAECNTTLYVKKVELEEFKKWFEQETGEWPFYAPAIGWDLCIEIEGGYGGYYWESLALKMLNAFKGIAFEGVTQVIFDDHIIGTTYKCNGKEVTLKRYIELPSDCYDEDEEFEEDFEDTRDFFEAENDIPYLVKFSAKEVKSLFEAYEVIGEKLNDNSLVGATCDERKISIERFIEFANILNFKERK